MNPAELKQGDVVTVRTPNGFLMRPPKGKEPMRFVVKTVSPSIGLVPFNNYSKLIEPRIVDVTGWM